jgi:hypothetical protein
MENPLETVLQKLPWKPGRREPAQNLERARKETAPN